MGGGGGGVFGGRRMSGEKGSREDTARGTDL